MGVRYLLDTNMASYVIKGNVPRVRQRLVRVPMAEVGISEVTEAELRFGVARTAGASRLAEAVEEFLVRVEILPWDSAAAKPPRIPARDSRGRGRPYGQPRHDDRCARARRRGDRSHPRPRFSSGEAIENRGLDQNLTAGRVRF
jgi:predicted nucleic acid-binding protein